MGNFLSDGCRDFHTISTWKEKSHENHESHFSRYMYDCFSHYFTIFKSIQDQHDYMNIILCWKKTEESIQINTWCLSEQVRFCVNDLLQLCLLVHIFNQVFFFTQFISQHKVGLFPSFAFLSPTVCHPERNTMYFLYHLVWFGVLEGTWANIGPRLRWDSNKTPGITTHKKCILQWTKIY